jgi:hypothetical protein
MRTLKALLTVIVVLSYISCKNNKEKEKDVDTVIIKENEQPRDKTDVPPAGKEKADDGTTIHMDDDGVSIENKDGNKETDVKVSKDSSRIIIKRPNK